MSDKPSDTLPDAVAIIGVSGRFPGAADVRQFWRNLRDAKESISFFTDEELVEAGVDPALLALPGYVKAAAMLEGSQDFAASFFGYTAKEAELTDPQHRVFIECAWEALEDAGHVPERYQGRIGIYAGSGLNSYMIANLLPNQHLLESMGVLQLVIGNRSDFMPTKVSYKLDLDGASVNVNTACSTSLVAVHMACRSLLNYECDMVLAGGVTIEAVQKRGYLYQSGGVLSPDGHCRAFDARAQGTVGGNGAGVVLLKRLDEAVGDGDHIYAVIRGSAINNDGAQKIGYTAPGVDGQKEVIALALAMAEVEPHTIGYVEAHGTGTALGDPIEVSALTQAFRTGTDKTGYCALGSVKSNIGHLDAAAGVASLIKTALCLEHRELVPSLHYEQANPAIDFASTPFYVNAALRGWTPIEPDLPLRAGVSSFGIGGTNAHVVLEEAPRVPHDTCTRTWHPLVLSAQTESEVEAATQRLLQALEQTPDLPIADVAYTLQVGRRAYAHRRLFLCSDGADARRVLAERDPARCRSGRTDTPNTDAGGGIVFMFPGIGDQYDRMAEGLYRDEPVFRRTVDECARFLQPLLGVDLRDLLYPKQGAGTTRREGTSTASGAIDLRKLMQRGATPAGAGWTRETGLVHPALFMIEVALARMLIEWGVRPAALIGHSLGEYAAVCVAGVMTLEEGLTVVAERARLIQALPEGRMLAVALPADDLKPMLSDGLSIAALNGVAMSVVAGETALVDALERHLREQAVACLSVQSAHAFHSTMLEPVQAPLRALFEKIALKAPAIPYLSNLTGTWITAEQATDPGYWARHTCQTVRFGDGLATLCDGSARTFIEIGPGQTLSSFLQQHPAAQARNDVTVLPSMPSMHEQADDGHVLARTLGSLWCQGHPVDWARHHEHERRRRVSLPTYPYTRQRCWIDGRTRLDRMPVAAAATPAVGNDSPGLYRAVWSSERAHAPDMATEVASARSACWLIVDGDLESASVLAERLTQRGQRVIRVRPGDHYERLAREAYLLRPDSPDDHALLAAALKDDGGLPEHVVHLLAVHPQAGGQAHASLLGLARAFGGAGAEAPVQMAVVSCGAQAVTGEEQLDAAAAALLGTCRAIPLEFSNLRCSHIDIARPAQHDRLADCVLRELHDGLPTDDVAYRGSLRWTRTWQPITPAAGSAASLLRRGGTYLLDDYRPSGLSHLLAEHLARDHGATLVLIVADALPPRDGWQDAIASEAVPPSIRETIHGALALEAFGATLVVIDGVDAADPHAGYERVARRELRLDGVLHTLTPFDANLIQFDGGTAASGWTAQRRRTEALEQAIDNLDPGFVAMFSSNVGLTGAVGQAQRCIASAVVQCLADRIGASNRRPVLSIVLDSADEAVVPAQSLPAAVSMRLDAAHRRYAIDGPQLAKILPQVLASGLPPLAAVSAQPVDDVAREMRSMTLQAVVHDMRRSAEARSHAQRPPYVAPRTEIEEQVAAIWQQLLGTPQIGADDSFFHLGGNSLLAVQFVSRMREAYEIDLALKDLFQASTVAEIAAVVEDILLQEIEALSDDEVSARVRASVDDSPGRATQASTPYELPNGLVVQQFNPVETDHFYRDIFDARVYFRNGIALDDGAIVFDVGANVGLFSLFAHRQCRKARVYAFEPAPPIFEALQANLAVHGVDATLFNCGVAARAGTARLTFYPNSTGMSSFHADKAEEQDVLRAIMENQLHEGMPGMQQVMAHADDILEERFRELPYDCELVTLSDVIRSHGVPRIDLLKIDVQKSEVEVLEGIEADHWPLVRQLVAEVHDLDGRVAKVRALLERLGFRVVVEQELLYRTSTISNVYGIRP